MGRTASDYPESSQCLLNVCFNFVNSSEAVKFILDLSYYNAFLLQKSNYFIARQDMPGISCRKHEVVQLTVNNEVLDSCLFYCFVEAPSESLSHLIMTRSCNPSKIPVRIIWLIVESIEPCWLSHDHCVRRN